MELLYPPFDYVHHNDRHYSNLGYSIPGIATERAAKTGYAAYVQNNILNPLKTTNSSFLQIRS
jgi:CubicO group peptidase (beta-lactamase class C family)